MKKTNKMRAPLRKSGFLVLGSLVTLGIAAVGGNSESYAAACNRYAKTIGEAICLQDMNDSVKASMQLERQYQLKDFRDGKSYYIAKLADGNVWMTQNLDLDLSTNVALTPDDSDIKDNWTPKRATYRLINDWQSLSGEPESLDVGDLYWDGELEPAPSGGVVYNSSRPQGYGAIDSGISDSGDPHYHLGNYYNWSAAMATNDVTPFVESGKPSDQSICPAGWMLPDVVEKESGQKGTQSKTISRLLSNYLDTESPIESAFASPVYFNPAGMIDPYGGYGFGEIETIWGKVIGGTGGGDERLSKDSAKPAISTSLMATATMVRSQNTENSSAPDNLGVSVRCVARDRAAEEVEPIDDSNWNWVEGQEYVLESKARSVLRFSIPLSDFESVAVDGKTLTRNADYDATNNGTTLSFRAAYLDTLALGEHDVTANFSGGRVVETTLTISDSPSVPNTGNSTKTINGAVAIMGLPMIGIAALAAGFYKGRDKSHRKFD